MGQDLSVGGRVAVVTGGSRGIGAACAVALARDGHRVAVLWSRDSEGGERVRTDVEALGGEALSLQADVADPASVAEAFKQVEQAWGPAEVLVNNAGVNRDGLVMRMTDEAWGEVMRTNLDGAFHTIRRATPGMMKARFGRIVNVGSVVATLGSAGQANYAAAKGGLIGLTRSVARELASRGITCNLVAPGPIATAMTDALDDQRKADITTHVPLARFGTPEEVGAVVAFLCSEAAGYVTGAVIPVDGGMGMGH